MVYDNPDVVVTNHGTITLVQPITESARVWVEENVAVEDWAWTGPAFAVEPRMAGNLIAGMREDGLEVAA